MCHSYKERVALGRLTNSTKQCPSWQANRSSASQKIPDILWNPKVHYRVQKTPSPVPVFEPDQTSTCPPPTHFLKIHYSTIFPSTPRYFKWSPSLRFLHQNPTSTTPLTHTCHNPCPPHSPSLDRPNNIWRVQIMKQSPPLPCNLVPLRRVGRTRTKIKFVREPLV